MEVHGTDGYGQSKTDICCWQNLKKRSMGWLRFLYKVKNDLTQGDGTPFGTEFPLLVKASDFPHHSTAIGTQIVG